MGSSFRILMIATLSLFMIQCKSRGDLLMLVGTYTGTDSKGIYVYEFNSSDGSATELSTTDGIENPSFLALHGDYVYAVSETGGDTPGSVFSYRLDKNTGQLVFLNRQLSGGDAPCYAEVDETGNFVAVANYSGGSVAMLSVDADGSLKNEKQVIQHIGSGADPERQLGPHAHQAVFTPDQKYLLVPDLGKDRVMIYGFNKDADDPLIYTGEVVCNPASGPRHLSFHPSGNWFYLINELKPEIEVYQFESGKATFVQRLSTNAEGVTGNNDGAEVKVSPDGKFLYSSQRGKENTIGIFEIDKNTGELTSKGFVDAGGKGPRDFNFDPSGKFLLVANQGTNNIVVFKVNKRKGTLTQEKEINVPIPVCIQFVSRK
ncbi:MAG: lactonase family protein [Chitinophagaceae bacterium]|nr:lactonase family protein [Chitinophagaceae bacterium]